MKRLLPLLLACIFLAACSQKIDCDMMQRISCCDLSYTVIHPDTIPTDDFFPGRPEKYWDNRWRDRPAPLGYRGADYERFDMCFTTVKKSGAFTYSINGWTACKRIDLPFNGWIQLDSVKEYGGYYSEVEKDTHSPDNPVTYYRLYAHYFFSVGLNNIVSAEMSGLSWYDIAEYDGILYYDGTGLISDGYCNNQYEGIWVDKATGDTLVCNWGDFRIPASNGFDIGAGEFSVAPEYRQNGWEDDYYPYRYGYSRIHDTLCTVLEEKVTQAEWEEAYAYRQKYNYFRDTTDTVRNSHAKEAAIRTLSQEGFASYHVWGDISFKNISHFTETDEDIVDIWHENDMEAVFVSHNKADSCIIAGGDYGIYGKNRIYVGCAGFDCDNHVWLFFYQTFDEPYHHTFFLCEYRNGATFDRPYETQEELDQWYLDNPMVWYKGALYFRAFEYYEWTPIYYKLRLSYK